MDKAIHDFRHQHGLHDDGDIASIAVFDGPAETALSGVVTATDLYPDVVPVLAHGTLGPLQCLGTSVEALTTVNAVNAYAVVIRFEPAEPLLEIRQRTAELHDGVADLTWHPRVVLCVFEDESTATQFAEEAASPAWHSRLCQPHSKASGLVTWRAPSGDMVGLCP